MSPSDPILPFPPIEAIPHTCRKVDPTSIQPNHLKHTIQQSKLVPQKLHTEP